MRPRLFCFVILFVIFFIGCSEKGAISDSENVVRRPAVAGAFYPGGSAELAKAVDQYLANARIPAVEGKLFALIVPHAGYVYSGQVAAYGFKFLEGKKIDTVILIGNSHRAAFGGVSIFAEGSFETPLGIVEVDSGLAASILKENKKFAADNIAHNSEHSLEVEIPFLQRTLKDFKIVPILFGNRSKDDYKILAEAISKNIKEKKVLLVASSDLSHYPSYDDARIIDKEVVDAILSGSVSKLTETIKGLEARGYANTATCACGVDAIKTVMESARLSGADEVRLLSAANSGDVSGDKSKVVGYASVGFFKKGSKGEEGLLNGAQQKELLDIARKTVETFVSTGKIPGFKVIAPALNEKLGAFVTIREEGRLRGCIGSFSPTKIPLYEVVRNMAVAAASEDPRFRPVQKDELRRLQYEISVLSALKEAGDWKKIRAGIDGVKLINGFRGGVFLPQVATENNWDLKTFLSELCYQKAGLPPDCYKDKNTKLYTFTAQVFGEE